MNKNKEEKRIGSWIYSNTRNITKHRTNIMKNPDIYKQWITFTQSEEYSQYF
jgi:hypothetical protein